MDMESALPGSRSLTVRARVPASIANLGPGFDVFSIALESPRIEVEFTAAGAGTKTIIVEGAHASEINTNPGMNPSGKALSALFDEFGKPEGYVLRIRGNIPPSKGLGLSGAEAVGAIVCANRHFHLGLKAQALVNIAAKAEPSNHMDNVSASALGGFNIVAANSLGEIGAITFPPPKDLGLAVLVPNVEKTSTEAARQLVPSQVKTSEHVRSMGHAARISAAFAKGDVQAILETLPWDAIVEPARADGGAYGRGVDSGFLLDEKKTLLEKFHVAETISGAGPSRALWYSISEDLKKRRKNKIGIIHPAIALVTYRLRSLGHEVLEVFLTRPSSKGATII
jgi:homoserine kinase